MYQQVRQYPACSGTESDPGRGIECEMDLRVRHVYPPVSSVLCSLSSLLLFPFNTPMGAVGAARAPPQLIPDWALRGPSQEGVHKR